MSDPKVPDLPSDEELGIAGLEEELSRERGADGPRTRDPDAKTPGPPPVGHDTPPPRSGAARPWRGPLTLLLLLALGFASSIGRTLPDARPLSAPDSLFSSGRAMLDLVRIARRAHPTGSPDHARVRTLLVERLSALGLDPQVRTATSLLRLGERVHAVSVRNLVARLPGTASTGAILLTAHYDGSGISRAAGDDGSGVAAILETLRALRSGAPLRNDVIVLLSDGEELGLMGARAFVRENPWLEDVALVLSVEMRGGGGPSIMFETGANNGWVIEAYGDAAPRPLANSMAYEVYRRMPNDTDFTPFARAGVQGLNFAAIGDGHVYHQAYDTPARFDERTLQHHGTNLLAATRELGGRDLADVDAAQRVFFTLPILGLVSYPATAGYALAVVLAVAFVVLLVRVRHGGGGWGGVGVGFALAALGVAACAGLSRALFEAVKGFHPEWGALEGSAFHVEGWYVAAMAAFAVTCVSFLLAVARRRFGLGALAAGAAALPVMGALAATFAAPMAAMNLQWPALAVVVGALLVAGVGRGGRPGTVAWLLLLPLAAIVLAFVVPVIELVWLSLSVEAALILGALMGLGAVLLIPILDALREPGGGWAPLLGLVLAAAFIGVGLAHARPSARRPAPSTLVYALDHESGSAMWASRDDGGLSWARARVGELGSIQPLDDYLMGDAAWNTGVAPVADVPEPRVLAVSDTTLAGRRSLSLAVRSEAGAEMIAVRLPASEDVHLSRVNGIEVPAGPPDARVGAGRVRLLTHYGVPAPAQGVTLELDVAAAIDTLRIEVIEHHLRPAELVGERYFLRPPALAPNVSTRSDRALMRTVVPLALGSGAPAPAAAAAASPPP